jgi:hypothetical protein
MDTSTARSCAIRDALVLVLVLVLALGQHLVPSQRASYDERRV